MKAVRTLCEESNKATYASEPSAALQDVLDTSRSEKNRQIEIATVKFECYPDCEFDLASDPAERNQLYACLKIEDDDDLQQIKMDCFVPSTSPRAVRQDPKENALKKL